MLFTQIYTIILWALLFLSKSEYTNSLFNKKFVIHLYRRQKTQSGFLKQISHYAIRYSVTFNDSYQ